MASQDVLEDTQKSLQQSNWDKVIKTVGENNDAHHGTLELLIKLRNEGLQCVSIADCKYIIINGDRYYDAYAEIDSVDSVIDCCKNKEKFIEGECTKEFVDLENETLSEALGENIVIVITTNDKIVRFVPSTSKCTEHKDQLQEMITKNIETTTQQQGYQGLQQGNQGDQFQQTGNDTTAPASAFSSSPSPVSASPVSASSFYSSSSSSQDVENLKSIFGDNVDVKQVVIDGKEVYIFTDSMGGSTVYVPDKTSGGKVKQRKTIKTKSKRQNKTKKIK